MANHATPVRFRNSATFIRTRRDSNIMTTSFLILGTLCFIGFLFMGYQTKCNKVGEFSSEKNYASVMRDTISSHHESCDLKDYSNNTETTKMMENQRVLKKAMRRELTSMNITSIKSQPEQYLSPEANESILKLDAEMNKCLLTELLQQLVSLGLKYLFENQDPISMDTLHELKLQKEYAKEEKYESKEGEDCACEKESGDDEKGTDEDRDGEMGTDEDCDDEKDADEDRDDEKDADEDRDDEKDADEDRDDEKDADEDRDEKSEDNGDEDEKDENRKSDDEKEEDCEKDGEDKESKEDKKSEKEEKLKMEENAVYLVNKPEKTPGRNEICGMQNPRSSHCDKNQSEIEKYPSDPIDEPHNSDTTEALMTEQRNVDPQDMVTASSEERLEILRRLPRVVLIKDGCKSPQKEKINSTWCRTRGIRAKKIRERKQKIIERIFSSEKCSPSTSSPETLNNRQAELRQSAENSASAESSDSAPAEFSDSAPAESSQSASAESSNFATAKTTDSASTESSKSASAEGGMKVRYVEKRGLFVRVTGFLTRRSTRPMMMLKTCPLTLYPFLPTESPRESRSEEKVPGKSETFDVSEKKPESVTEENVPETRADESPDALDESKEENLDESNNDGKNTETNSGGKKKH